MSNTSLINIRGAVQQKMRGRLSLQASALIPVISIFIVIILGFGLTTERFLEPANILNVLRQGSPSVIIAVGSTLVLVAAGIDLSTGSVVSIVGVALALMIGSGVPPTLALIGSLVIGTAMGCLNGYFIAYQELPSFIVTLASLSIMLGAAEMLSQGFSVPIDVDSWVLCLGEGYIGPLPIPVLLAAVSAVIGWVVLARSAYGMRLRGIGSNEESVRRAGVPVKRLALSVYAVSSFTAAVAGVVVAARLEAGTATAGTNLELQVIAAIVLGGTSLFGGKGSIVGSVLGVYTLGFINNGLVLNHINPFFLNIVQGSILLLALWTNKKALAFFRRSKAKGAT